MSNTQPKPNHSTSLTYQLNREAKWSIYLTFLYMAGWVIFAYFTPTRIGVLGLPLWFELSCVFLPLIFILMSMAVLKTVYKEVDLDNGLNDNLNNPLNNKPNRNDKQGENL